MRIAAVLLLAMTAVARAQATDPARVDSSGAIVGIVTIKESDLPLPYSVASVLSLSRERFSNDKGVFYLGDLPAGPLRLRIRHLGYSPADLSVVIRAGQTDTIRVSLTHIAVRLAAMEVHDYPPCTTPGAPRAALDSAFAAVFDQLRMNAEQYRLLSRTYPYITSVERSFSMSLRSGRTRFESTDTSSVASSTSWAYRPGSVLEKRSTISRIFGRSGMTMNVPTLVTFADPTFIENHCFYNGGVETVAGDDLLRIDFTASERIKDPDVNGSMYLDQNTFQIRRSVLRLSKIPSGLQGLLSTEAITYFGEVLPTLPMIVGIESVNRFSAKSILPDTPTAAREEQRLIAVHFLQGRPGDEPKRP